MELPRLARVVSFLAVVLALAGLCLYLFLPSASGAGRTAGHPPARTPAGGTLTRPPTSAGTAGGGSAAVPDIYQWLPFSQAGLASAAAVTVRFAQDYGTFSYAQSAAAYLAPMKPLITGQLAQVLARAYATPAVAAARAAARQRSVATAVITALRSFGPTSLTFAVTITENITSDKGSGSQRTDYAITLTGSGTSWQVSDIELASAGNQ